MGLLSDLTSGISNLFLGEKTPAAEAQELDPALTAAMTTPMHPAAVTAADAMADAAAAVAPVAEAPAAGNDGENTAVSPGTTITPMSMTHRAYAYLLEKLKGQTVTLNGQPDTPFPVESLRLSSDSRYSGRAYVRDSEASIPQGDPVSLVIRLSGPETDADDPASLQAAVVQMLNTEVPALKGKVIAAPANDQTYGEVIDTLKALIATKKKADGTTLMSDAELAVLETWKQAHIAQKDVANSEYDQAIRANHWNEKLAAEINAKPLANDNDPNNKVSSDSLITEFFDEARQKFILDKVKEKVLAANVGLTADDLKDLHMYIAPTGWRIEAQFGTKPTSDIDPLTKEKLKPAQYAAKMTETKLTKIDTNQFAKMFQEALIESQNEINPIMARIMDPQMLEEILRKRAGNDPELEAFFAKHPMFKSPEEATAEKKAAAAAHQVIIEQPICQRTHDDQAEEMRFEFNLPPGMKLREVLKGIADQAPVSHVGRVQTAAANENDAAAAIGRVA